MTGVMLNERASQAAKLLAEHKELLDRINEFLKACGETECDEPVKYCVAMLYQESIKSVDALFDKGRLTSPDTQSPLV